MHSCPFQREGLNKTQIRFVLNTCTEKANARNCSLKRFSNESREDKTKSFLWPMETDTNNTMDQQEKCKQKLRTSKLRLSWCYFLLVEKVSESK